MILDHMQYKQSSEFSETHREESEISEFIRPYKNAYVAVRIPTKHNYTELRANPDHPYLTRQGGQTPNSYNEEETNKQLNDEHLKELTNYFCTIMQHKLRHSRKLWELYHRQLLGDLERRGHRGGLRAPWETTRIHFTEFRRKL